MLITAYVFIGQQSHMSDMPLLHVICTTVKGNCSCLSRRLIMAVGTSDKRFVCVFTDVYLLAAVSRLRRRHSTEKNVKSAKLADRHRKIIGLHYI